MVIFSAKTVPGASPEIIQQMGYLADRMSINMELPTSKSLQELAPNKTHAAILKPMKQIQEQISDYRLSIGKTASMERHAGKPPSLKQYFFLIRIWEKDFRFLSSGKFYRHFFIWKKDICQQ